MPANKKSIKWPVIIVGLLLIHVIGMMTAVTIATTDKSFAVLPNYYQEAVKWDQTKAVQQASDQLGWKAELIISGTEDPKRERLVAVRITNSKGEAVNPEKVELKYYHYSHASQGEDITLLSRDGKVEGSLPLRYEGFYEFNLTAHAGDKVFVEKLTQYVNAAAKE